MAIITEVRFAHEDGALAATLTALPGLDVTVIGEASTDPDTDVYYLRFDHDGDDEVLETVESDPTVSDVTPIREVGETYILGIEFEEETELLAPLVTAESGFVLDARSQSAEADPRGWHERWLLPDRQALQTIWQHASERGFEFDILEVHRGRRTDTEYPGPDALTEEQREALIAAYEQGYFAEPRETSLEELADELDLSASAVGGRINRGLKALIGAALVRGTEN